MSMTAAGMLGMNETAPSVPGFTEPMACDYVAIVVFDPLAPIVAIWVQL